MPPPLILLDRDGVINEDRTPHGTLTTEEFRLIPGAAKAISLLTAAGIKIAIISNQSALGKGLLTQDALEAIHQKMRDTLAEKGGRIDAIYICGDHPDRATHRRKPAPGMVLEALHDFGAHPQRTPMIGDALRDLEAAHAAGCPRWLVRTGKGEKTLANGLPSTLAPVAVFEDLLAAAHHYLEQTQQKS